MPTPNAAGSGLGPSGARACRHAAPHGPDCRNACGARKVARSCRARGAPAGRAWPAGRSVPSCDCHGRVRVAHFREHVKGGQAAVHGGRRAARTGGGARRRRGRAASQGGIRQGHRPACERFPAQGRRARVCTTCHGPECVATCALPSIDGAQGCRGPVPGGRRVKARMRASGRPCRRTGPGRPARRVAPRRRGQKDILGPVAAPLRARQEAATLPRGSRPRGAKGPNRAAPRHCRAAKEHHRRPARARAAPRCHARGGARPAYACRRLVP